MVKVQVYLSNGNVHSYDVDTELQAREHADAIIRTGYRSVSEDAENVLTWWPPHAIVKVKVVLPEPSTTKYTDRVRGT